MTPDDLAGRAATWAKLTGPTDSALVDCAAAVLALVEALPGGTVDPWGAETTLGAVMLTARLYRRRNSPAGIESLTEMGATYVSRYDSDIARLLRIDAFQGPVAV